MATRIVLNNAELNRLLKSRSGGVGKAIFTKGKKVESEAKRRCPVDSGRLRSSISTEISLTNKGPVARVGTNVKYAVFVHEGTGVFGPRRTIITPKRSRFLVFRPKGAIKKVFAKRVRGMRGTPFLEEALNSVMRRSA